MRISTLLVAVVLLVTSGWAKISVAADDLRVYNLDKEYRVTQTKAFKFKRASVLEAKDIVARTLSIYGALYANEQENTLYVTDTPEKLADLQGLIRALDKKGLKAGGNLGSELIPIKHNKSADIIAYISHKLSPSGKVFQVGDQNAVLITDIKSKRDEIAGLIKEVDREVRHVLIDVMIMEVNGEKIQQAGIDILGWLQEQKFRTDHVLEYRERRDENDGDTYESLDKNTMFRSSLRSDEDLVIGDMISALKRDGDGKMLVNTQIITKSNNAAYVDSTEYIPYQVQNSSQESSEMSGVYVSVTPIIQEDDYINLSVAPRIYSFMGWSPNNKPIVFRRSANTEVNVKNGESFVLAGLKKTEMVKSVRGVPILKDIPILGYLFSKRTAVELSREVVIILSPRIVEYGQEPPEKTQQLRKSLDSKTQELKEN